MITTRSPLRITLGGGGTDLPSYYSAHGGGFLIAGAIDRFVYVNVLRPFTPGIFLKYSKLERVEWVDQVEHPIMREALRLMDLRTPQIEITALADIPAGTGLGSSGSFTTALLKALYAHRMRMIEPKDLAELACRVEIDILGEPVGKQDQYVAAHGGICAYSFNPDDTVEVEPLELRPETLSHLRDRLLLFYTGEARSASRILNDQHQRSSGGDEAMLANLDRTKEMGYLSRALLEKGELDDYAQLMHEHWENKRRRSPGMADERIDSLYARAREAGAIGGKLVGAGGGGFLLVYSINPEETRRAMQQANAPELPFNFEYGGAFATESA